MREQDEIYRLLSTDYYELTMAKGYLDSRIENKTATFDLFVRSLPENWGFLIANGIEDAVDFLTQDFFFRSEDISYLKDQGFPEYFLDWLKDIKFTGDVWAVPEGTPVAPNTPILRVTSHADPGPTRGDRPVEPGQLPNNDRNQGKQDSQGRSRCSCCGLRTAARPGSECRSQGS